MPLARKYQVIPGQPGFYHCISRCVRGAWLCGRDPLSGKCYDYRRDRIVERLRLLTTCFAIDVFAYGVTSNHCHVVLYVDPDRLNGLSNEEIILRWKTLWNWRNTTGSVTVPTTVSDEQIALWRTRLADISWFMRSLNEPIARTANAEDGCKGHFWESRVKSIPLFDDASVLACLTCVDLNPIKEGIAETLEDSDYTCIQERLSSMCERCDDDSLVTRVSAAFSKLQKTAV